MDADLFAIPSLWEGCPNALAEAMAHGLPAIGFKVNGVEQLIQHNETGWLVPKITTTAFANELSSALQSVHHFETFGRQAIASLKSYTEFRTFGEWEKLIMSSETQRDF